MDEKALIERILAGDEKAMSGFYHSHYKRLVPIGVYMLGYHDPEIEDVVQETFLVAFQKLATFQPHASLYTWLAHICIHRCYKRLMRRGRILLPPDESLEMMTAGLSMRRHQEEGQEAEKKRRLEVIRVAMTGMDEKCRRIIELRDFEGTSYAHIAEIMKIQIGTVMSRLARCREALRRLVRGEWEGEA